MVSRRYERRKKLAMERWKRHARKWQANMALLRKSLFRWLAVLCVTVAVALGGFVLFSPVMAIREVQVQRTDPRLDIEEVQRILAPFFGRHLLFLSEPEVRQVLRRHLTDLASADVGKLYPATLVVRIQLDPLRARLLIAEPDAVEVPVAGSGVAVTDFLTEKGVYVTAPQVSAQDLPSITLVDWGVRPVPGTTVLPPAFLERLDDAEIALREQFGYNIERRTVYLRAQEFHFDIGAYTLWFDTRNQLTQQLARYRAFLREVDTGEVQEYVDLRPADRVVYR